METENEILEIEDTHGTIESLVDDTSSDFSQTVQIQPKEESKQKDPPHRI